jgi:hypothetical protein
MLCCRSTLSPFHTHAMQSPVPSLVLPHYSYVGEIILWTGPSLLTLSPLLATVHTRGITGYFLLFASFPPAVFEYVASEYATGVPPLEQIAQDKFGDDEGWREYKEKVPVLFAWPGSNV